MSGIYIHIPFCKQACHYCDFHFSTNTGYTSEMIRCIIEEIGIQSHYLIDPVETIYFGGGTPSVIATGHIASILETIKAEYKVMPRAEVTLEANPDDMDIHRLNSLAEAGINRLSIGIQSFDREILNFLNRAHDDVQAGLCLKNARKAGYTALNADLIYGIPARSHRQWKEDIEQLLGDEPEHISAYCLTIEPKTVFGHWQKSGKLPPTNDDFAAEQYEILTEMLGQHGYEHYEVSNFCKPGHYAKHNTAYWKQKPYLGVGPGAHSYNTESRQCNIENNSAYMQSVKKGQIPCERELLTARDNINDMLLTGLRTKWGVDLEIPEVREVIDMEYIKKLEDSGNARLVENRVILTEKGWLLADKISSDLFI